VPLKIVTNELTKLAKKWESLKPPDKLQSFISSDNPVYDGILINFTKIKKFFLINCG
jgi:hypothetical protein